jgi:hypothetical protein
VTGYEGRDDYVENVRRAMLREMPDELRRRVEAGERVWTTEELQRDFDVLGFAAPLVVVRRRSDGVRGSLMFTHQPRYYFGWETE